MKLEYDVDQFEEGIESDQDIPEEHETYNRRNALDEYKRAKWELQTAREYQNQMVKIMVFHQVKTAWNTMKSPKRVTRRWQRSLPIPKE
jgi:hypothetical protein